MSEEQKETIVVKPHFGAEAPAGEQGNDQTSSESASGDQSSQGQQNLPVIDASTSSATQQAAQSASTPSDQSTPAMSQSAEGDSGNGQAGASSSTDGSTPDTSSVSATDSSTSPSSTTNSQNSNATGQLVNGSVTTTVTPPPAPAPEPTPAPAPQAPSFIQSGITEVDKLVETLMKDASIPARAVINTIKEYIVKMKPGVPMAQKDILQNQVAFYNAIRNAINDLEGDFRPTMQAILALMHHHRDGAFRETHVFRGIDQVPLSAEHRHAWRKLTTMLKTLANPGTRQELLRQMHFENITQYGLTERGRAKLSAFFGK